jgi:hypothetical protein
MNDLVDGNPRAFDTRLTVTDFRIDGNPLERHVDTLLDQFTPSVRTSLSRQWRGVAETLRKA